MADQKVFYLYSVDAGGNLVHQIRNERLNPAITLTRDGPGGHVDDEFLAIGGGRPALTFQTSAIARALAQIGDIDGLKIDATPFTCYFAQGEQGGTRLAGANHLRLQIAKGLSVPTTLRAPHAPPALIDYQVMGRMDGANDPISITSNIALPAVALTGEQFCAGPVVINATEYEGISDITLNFGINMELQSDKGYPWLRYVGIRNRTPSLTVRLTDSDAIATIGIAGTKITADVEVYLRKCLLDGTRVPDATAEHIKITAEAGIVTINDSGATSPNIADNSLMITPRKDGATPILAFDLSSYMPGAGP